jgi:hypothetical protein
MPATGNLRFGAAKGVHDIGANPRFIPRAATLCLALVCLLLSARQCLAQDFRIDTEVFIGKEKEPAAETLTLFASGQIYDFLLQDPEEITLLDPVRGRLTMLDKARQIKCSLNTQELLDLSLAYETQAGESKDSLFSFAARPDFAATSEDVHENGQDLVKLSLVGKPLEYHAVGRRPERLEAVRSFRYFADFMARLNSQRPGNLPAGARLELNKQLAERELLPVEITRTIPPSNPLTGKRIEVRSHHLVSWALSGEDRKRIDRAGTYLAEFRAVNFEEYRRAIAQPVENKTDGQQARR